MPNFLLLTDVFCPWCYGFAPVMRRLRSEHPDWPVRVLGGGLMDEPSTVAEMAEEMPSIREFFVRLAATTGQPVGDAFLSLLDSGRGRYVRMYSPGVAVPLRALKTLDPGREAEQIEAFQTAFYGEGRDVLSPEVQHELAASFGVDAAAFDLAARDESLLDAVQRDMEEAAAIMGEFTLYPTLYLEDGGQRRLLARGFAPCEEVAARIADIAATPVLGPVCSLDGHCD